MIEEAESPFPSLNIRLLGPIQVVVAGEALRRPRSRKTLWALALLTLRGGRPVAREWLAQTLWPDVEREAALANLRPAMSDLRQLLGPEAHRLHSPDRSLLQFDLEGADVDVIAFDAAIKLGKRTNIQRAVDLYRGALLEGCSEEWVPQERDAREQDFLHALLALADAALAAGDATRAEAMYRRAIGVDPWRDAPRRGLMESLARNGDRNAALHVYREFIDFIRDDARAAPSEATTRLYERLRREARHPARTTGDVLKEEPSVEGYLPVPLTEIVGREDERTEVMALLKRSRLVTLTGAGGIGKTRLSLAVATELQPNYPDGVWFVGLESLTEEGIERGLAASLGLRESITQSPLAAITEHVRKKRLLLVLDNCEHVLESSARMVSNLLAACGNLRILATSREALRLSGETAWAVPALATPVPEGLPKGLATMQRVMIGYEGVRLFIERARATDRNFMLTGGNAFLIAQVCARLEGMPLAIELAAARTKSVPLEAMVERLDDHLALLVGGDRAGSVRQKTLRSTLDWSYDLLDADERLLLGRLSVFVGGWTLLAAEAVCSGAGIGTREVSRLLSLLVDKSLVVFEEPPSGEGGRYRLLEMVRQYAAEKLAQTGDHLRLRAKHYRWFYVLGQAAEPHLNGAEQPNWLQQLANDSGNLLLALEFKEDEPLESSPRLELASTIWRFWFVRGDYSEGLFHLLKGLDEDDRPTLSRAKALQGIGLTRFTQGKLPEAQKAQEAALEICRILGNRAGEADSLGFLASIARRKGDESLGRTLTESCLAIRHEIGDQHGIALALGNLGVGLYDRGDYAEARSSFEESYGIFRQLEIHHAAAWALVYLASIDDLQGRYEEARSGYEHYLLLCDQLGSKRGVAVAMQNLGEVSYRCGEFDEARDHLQKGLAIYRRLGDLRGLVGSLLYLAEVDLVEGDLSSARCFVLESQKVNEEYGDKRSRAAAYRIQSDIALLKGDSVAAVDHARDCLRELEDGRLKPDLPASLETAAAAFAGATAEKSALLAGAACRIRAELGIALPFARRKGLERLTTELRTLLGAQLFQVRWEEGKGLDWATAVANAMAP